MIALGLVVEAVAGVLVVAGVVTSSVPVLWTSTVIVLVGLLLVVAGLRRARPPARGVVSLLLGR